MTTAFQANAFQTVALAFQIDSAPPPTVTPNTPGFIRPLGGSRGESEDEKTARRIREGSLPEPIADQQQEYAQKSQKLVRAIARVRADTRRLAIESGELRARIAAAEAQNRERQAAKARAELLRNEQAATLARAEEEMLLEQMEVIDVAYVAYMAVFALTMVLQ